jgi:HEAT repeat protein
VNKGLKIVLIIVVVLVVIGGIVGGVVYYMSWKAQKDIEDLVKAPEHKNLQVEEVKKLLKGGDFKAKIEARRQIDNLEPEDKLLTLIELMKEDDVNARLIAVKLLTSIKDKRATAALEKAAKEDKDETVRSIAASALAPVENPEKKETPPEEPQTKPSESQ